MFNELVSNLTNTAVFTKSVSHWVSHLSINAVIIMIMMITALIDKCDTQWLTLFVKTAVLVRLLTNSLNISLSSFVLYVTCFHVTLRHRLKAWPAAESRWFPPADPDRLQRQTPLP